jgi:hypothetical protein
MCRPKHRLAWEWPNSSFVPWGNVCGGVVQATSPSLVPYTVLGRGDGCTPPCAVCARSAQRVHGCSLDGPHIRQAQERPAMLAHPRRRDPAQI